MNFPGGSLQDRRRLYMVLLGITLVTLPCYCAGILAIRRAPVRQTVTPTPTETVIPSATWTPVTSTATLVPTETFTPTVTATFFIPPSATPSPTASDTPTPTITATPTATWTPTLYPAAHGYADIFAHAYAASHRHRAASYRYSDASSADRYADVHRGELG